MKISKSLLPAAALVALFAGCQDEDFGYQSKEIKYQSEFKKAFGEIDPEQDWSMATRVTANLENVPNGVLEIYYKNPVGRNAAIIARKHITDGTANFDIDVVKGVKELYVRIGNEKGYYPLNGFYKIENGELNIGSATTRAAEVPQGASTAKIGDTFDLYSTILDLESGLLELAPAETGDDARWVDGYWKVKSTGANVHRTFEYFKDNTFTNLHHLYGVLDDDQERPVWTYGDAAEVFCGLDGGFGVFAEARNHTHLMLEGSVPQLEMDIELTVGEDNTPVYLDYFMKGTQYDNEFGYFYYTGEMTAERFLTIDKYILLDNASTQDSKISYNSKDDKRTWNLLNVKGITAITQNNVMPETTFDNALIGTRLPLTYFGENYDKDGVYEFPKGTKIGLFFLGREQSRSDNGNEGMLLTSISSINRDLYSESPHAAVFRYNGNIFYGMEDQVGGGGGCDNDLNDILFILNGNFEEDIPEIDPVDPVFQSWTIACEDLGGSFDYDFNDLVFAVSKELDLEDDTKANLTITGLAAGGTLDAKIKYGDVAHEVHSFFGAEKTNAAINVDPSNREPEAGQTFVYAKDIPADLSIEKIMEDLKIVVTTGSGDEEKTETSAGYNIGWAKDKEDTPKEELSLTPQVLILPQGWDWPSEGTLITDVYPGFEKWTGDASVDSWIETKKDGSDYIFNPMKPVVPSGNPDVDPSQPDPTPSEPVYPAWNIKVNGSLDIPMYSTVEYTFTVVGVDDLSSLTLDGGVYTTEITMDKSKLSEGKFSITAGANKGKYRFYIKADGDDTHSLKRAVYEVNVIDQIPEFAVKVNGISVKEDGTSVINTKIGAVSLEINSTKAGNNVFELSSSDSEVASISGNEYYNTFNALKVGEATITVKHKAVAGEWTEKSISFKLKVIENGGTTGGGETGGGSEPEKDPITAGTYNLEIPTPTTYTASWGTSYQAYTMNVGDYSCPDGLTGKVTITLKDCPGNQLEIAPSTGNWLGRIDFYNGNKTATQTLTNAQLKQLLAGNFNVINYANSDVEMTSFTLVVE